MAQFLASLFNVISNVIRNGDIVSEGNTMYQTVQCRSEVIFQKLELNEITKITEIYKL